LGKNIMSGTVDSTTQQELQSRALELLEFPLVLERLAGRIQFSMARELALMLRPAHNREDILRGQRETSEAVQFLGSGNDLDISSSKDVRQQVERASLGSRLLGTELRDVLDVLTILGKTRHAVISQGDLPILSSKAREIPDLGDLESQIVKAIGRDGDVLDQASSPLAALRVESRSTYERLEEHLQGTLRHLQDGGVLQEPLITQRQGRMVLLVKSEMRHHVPGIVHDVSGSGATLFVEPLTIVSEGNQSRELRLAVEREEARVLQLLSAAVGARSGELLLGLDIVAHIDLVMAKGRYSVATDSVPATVVETKRPYLRFKDARHPLLSGEVVPNTIEMGNMWSLLLITGPNAGGKTVALKMAGLLSVMAHSGLHVPADEATLSVYDGFYADVGDQQSIQRSLSTFSSHVDNLTKILAEATPSSLVLIDELGTSTDPEEGTALSKAILLEFHRKGIQTIATSHLRDLTEFIRENPGMVNASVELHPETLDPTFRLIIGLSERSYAITIAARLGMPQAVINDARSLLSDDYRKMEGLLGDLQREKTQVAANLEEAEQEVEHAKKLRLELDEKLIAWDQEKNSLMESARRDLQTKVEDILQRLRIAERAAKRPVGTSPPKSITQAAEEPVPVSSIEALRDQRHEVSRLRRELSSPSWRPASAGRDWKRDLKPGDMVYMQGVSQPMEVLVGAADDQTLEIALGSMRAKISLDQIERKTEAAARSHAAAITVASPIRAPLGREIDVRGVRVEKALMQLDQFLDQAVVGGLSSVRIVHGVGTGALRGALREYLSLHMQVDSFVPDEGTRTDGATIAQLK
jgi:DNA mismatch repair protein MutS2